jgi:Fe2+ or Zn2+ uptake regulation protein
MPTPNSPPLSEQWLSILQESGYRLTAPRRAIVEIMATCERALSPVELFDLGRKSQPGLGLVTIYRTLEKMEELGLVQRVHQPDGCHMYLPAARGHQHLLICQNCGKAVLSTATNSRLCSPLLPKQRAMPLPSTGFNYLACAPIVNKNRRTLKWEKRLMNSSA